jgi:hypothetical protein
MPQASLITIATNVPVSAPVITPAVTLTGSLPQATVSGSVHVPASVNFSFVAEYSFDGVNWTPFFAESISNPAVPKLTDYGFVFTMPGALGSQARIRVYECSAPCVVNTLTINNG